MKRWFCICFTATALALCTLAGLALAEDLDPLKVGGKMYRLLLENERVRIMEVTFEPGEKIGMHIHPDHAVYFVEGGTLMVTSNGATSELAAKTGDAGWLPAQSHSAENVGKTRVRILVTELKEPAPAKAPAAPVDEHK
jgi:beta-alanine degradation protein BauB